MEETWTLASEGEAPASPPVASTSSRPRLSSAPNLAPTPHTHRHSTLRSPLRRQSRSSSAPSPHLTSTLQQHEFPLEPDATNTSLALWETKHLGASLKRIFVGPHIVGGGEGGGRKKGKSKVLDEVEAESGSSSGESEAGDDLVDGVHEEGRTRTMVRRLERARTREGKGGRRATFGSAVKHRERIAGGGTKASLDKWTGGSFEIGGDIREAARRREEASKRRAKSTRVLAATMDSARAAAGPQTFTTANTHAVTATTSTLVPKGDYTLEEPPPQIEETLPALTHALLRRTSDVHSETASLVATPTPAHTPNSPPPPEPKSILRTNSTPLGVGFPPLAQPTAEVSGAKTVQFPTTAEPSLPPPVPGPGDQPPAPAEDVLARPAVEDVGFLDADIVAAGRPRTLRRTRDRDAVIRQERMLVRPEWTEREDLPDSFNETNARKVHTTLQPWEEFAVVWRSQHLELWTAHSNPASTLFSGGPKLKHIIPFTPSRTQVSLYSSPDLVFCLTHRPSPSVLTTAATTRGGRALTPDPADVASSKKNSKRAYVHFRTAGTNIYTIRAKTTAITKEWMWELYRVLGGSVPTSLDVVVPGLGARISLPIPADLTPSSVASGKVKGGGGYLSVLEGEGYRLCTPEAVVEVCVKHLSAVGEWAGLMQNCKDEGVEMRLAWRRGEVLDWVETGEKASGWSVVVGLILTQPNLDTALELRPALHYPTTVPIPPTPSSPSKRISEPPGVEGYLLRHKPSGPSERVYLSTHDGHLFLCRPSTAQPPEPPLPVYEFINNPAVLVLMPFVLGFASMVAPAKRDKLWERMTGHARRKEERERVDKLKQQHASDQAEGDDGEVDILAKLESDERTRTMTQIVSARGFVDLRDITSVERAQGGNGDVEPTVDEDLGGEEGLAATGDRELLKRCRSFVIRSQNGVEVRFECYSISTAVEWVGRLGALSTYWARRERVDTLEQMELHPNNLEGRRLKQMQGKGHRIDRAPPDDIEALDLAGPLLGRIYNHCILEGCRSVVRSGTVYVRNGLRGVFRQRYVFLLQGVVLFFETKHRDVYGVPTKTAYHLRKGSHSLRGCYIYCGRLSPSAVSPISTTWTPADGRPQFPRIYASDGLRTSDEDEDCTLVIFKKAADGPSQGLGTKGKVIVLRARSRVERDEWLWALNVAISRLQEGSDREREQQLKEFKWLDSVKPIKS